jgi:hypothetical protein
MTGFARWRQSPPVELRGCALGLHSETSPRTSANMKITLFFVLTGLLVVAAAPTPQEVGESLVRMRELHGPTLAIDAQEGMTLFGTVSGMANASLNLDQPAMLPIAAGDWNIRVHGVFGCFRVSQPPVYFLLGPGVPVFCLSASFTGFSSFAAVPPTPSANSEVMAAIRQISAR